MPQARGNAMPAWKIILDDFAKSDFPCWLAANDAFLRA